jgi:drug/metabolite transporter (DMT)-like permease
MWLVLGSALLVAFSAIVEKRTLLREHAMEFAATLAIANLVITLPLFAWADLGTLSPAAVALIFIDSLLLTFAFYFMVKGLRHMEVSSASPLFVLRPAFVAVLAFIFLGEALTRMQAGGISLMVAGAYILETHRAGRLLDPIREFWQSKYVHYIISALFLYSVSALLGRYILARLGVEPLAYTAAVHVFLAANFFILLSVFHDGWRGIVRALREYGLWFALVAVLTMGYRVLDAMAVKVAFVGLVSALRSSSAFFATLLGGEIFHEHNLLRKAAACAVMLAGGALLVI